MNIFKEINDLGITVIIVTHEKDISEMTNKIIRLKDGLIESINGEKLLVEDYQKEYSHV
jgi:putative ABC transport system ATP-binding protein